MSIASEIQSLLLNKAAIKAAIEAKNPSVPPSGVLSEWPTSIASISGGGGGGAKPEQSKTVTPTAAGFTVSPDTGYALSSVVVNGDADLVAGNVKSGVEIFGVTGSLSPAKEEQSKTVTPTAAGFTVTPDTGKALSSVVVNGDADLVSGNVKSGVDIFGVTGSLAPEKEEQSKTVTPTASGFTVTPDTGKALSSVVVNGDADLVAGNVKSGVEIFGVTGSYSGDITEIIEATEAMDGLDHTDATSAQLASAIVQINRRQNRRPTETVEPPVQPAIVEKTGFENSNAFAITVTQDMINADREGLGGFTWGLCYATLATGHTEYSIDWGDGTQNTGLTAKCSTKDLYTDRVLGRNDISAYVSGIGTDGVTTSVIHTYTTPGTYVIQITDDLQWFRVGVGLGNTSNQVTMNLNNSGQYDLARRYYESCCAISYALRFGNNVISAYGTYYNCVNLVGCPAEWGTSIENATNTYNNCVKMVGPLPKWSDSVTNANNTYYNCIMADGVLPPWGKKITNANGTYTSCMLVTGGIPEWDKYEDSNGDLQDKTGNDRITTAAGTYMNCCGLVGPIPAWGAAITNAGTTYSTCTGLTGTIPEWNDVITTATSTYNGCTGLTGRIPAWNSTINTAGTTYTGCFGLTGNIPAWNDKITVATSTYQNCQGLTGPVPAWGAKINTAGSTYNGCSGLTGPVPAWNNLITAATSCYTSCSGLTGSVPEWGTSITNAQTTYSGCTGLTGNIPKWNNVTTNAQGTYTGCYMLSGTIPKWGMKITNASSCYINCRSLIGPPPAWDEYEDDNGNTQAKTGSNRITTAASTYSGCYRLTGPIPAWGAAITTTASTYAYCYNLTGPIPAWTSTITTSATTYQACGNLTGSVPAWGANIATATSTYQGCTGLTGVIPVWGAKITNANTTYEGAAGLSGVWNPSAADSALMPSKITAHSNTFRYCGKDLKDYFLTSWGGTRAS